MSSSPAVAVAAVVAPVPWTGGLLLPTTATPSKYDVALAPDLVQFTFQGQVRIELKVNQPTSEIVCHSLDLTYAPGRTFLFAAGSGGAGEPLQTATAIELDEPSQRVRFVFAQQLQPGAYTLSTVFTGILNDQLCGFYRSAYKSARTGRDTFMAVTQFEATDCRRALPCWDEPALKAVFAVTLIVDPSQSSMSNMPVTRAQTILQSAEEQARDPACREIVVPRGYIRYEYADSPVMSSYLLAFVVGEFDFISAFVESADVPGARPVELRIYCPVGETVLGEFALDIAKKCLNLYESYFQVPYPLPKLDLVAVPDFASGAMENWGILTYRDTMLLIDPANSSALVKQRCAKTIAHEIAHCWFGNLATMRWWSALWLNEGFARYCESWAIDCLFPEWQVMNQFVNEVYGLAQSLDSLESSHPIELEVSTPDEINEIFDPINYNKGASLIRMLIQTIGPAAFQKGLQLYLTEFAYKNATSQDLWDCMSRATALLSASTGGVVFDVESIMHLWVSEMGYPLLEVEELAAPHGKIGCTCFAVTQKRFLQTSTAAAASATTAEAGTEGAMVKSAGQVWQVPLAIGAYSTSQNIQAIGVTQRILDKLSSVIEIDQSASSTSGPESQQQLTYSFNHASTGFYRVHYGPALFSSLSTLVSRRVLPTLDRLALLRDCYSLSICGQGYDLGNLLDLLVLFQGERDFTCIQFLAIVLGNICALHADQAYALQLQKLVVRLFGERWQELGWGDSGSSSSPTASSGGSGHLTFLERSILVQMLGLHSGDASIRAHAWTLLQAFARAPTARPSVLQPDLRGPVYSLALKQAGKEARVLLQKLYAEVASSEEKVRILSALGTTRGAPEDDTDQEVRDLLDWIFKSGAVRNGDLIYALTAVGQDSKASRTVCWAYIKANWDDLLVRQVGQEKGALRSRL